MKKVYVVEHNDYEGSYLVAILSKESDAQSLAAQYGDDYTADEWILDAMRGAYKRTVYGYQNNLMELSGKHWTYTGVLPPKTKLDTNYDKPVYAQRYGDKILFCARSLVSPTHAEKLAKKAVADLLKKEKHEQAKKKASPKVNSMDYCGRCGHEIRKPGKCLYCDSEGPCLCQRDETFGMPVPGSSMVEQSPYKGQAEGSIPSPATRL